MNKTIIAFVCIISFPLLGASRPPSQPSSTAPSPVIPHRTLRPITITHDHDPYMPLAPWTNTPSPSISSGLTPLGGIKSHKKIHSWSNIPPSQGIPTAISNQHEPVLILIPVVPEEASDSPTTPPAQNNLESPDPGTSSTPQQSRWSIDTLSSHPPQDLQSTQPRCYWLRKFLCCLFCCQCARSSCCANSSEAIPLMPPASQ